MLGGIDGRKEHHLPKSESEAREYFNGFFLQ